jgi:hypothetical protein
MIDWLQDIETYIGKEAAVVVGNLRVANIPYVVLHMNGITFPTTRDYNPERRRLYIENNIITRVELG